MSDFDRKKSIKSVGQLYPVLLSKDGTVIDGFHRQEDDPEWKTETLEHVDSEEKLLLARAISNWHRRPIDRDEKEKWINGLAKLYQEQGYKINGERRTFDDGNTSTNEILWEIHQNTGLKRWTILQYLSNEFKVRGGVSPSQPPRVPASQRIRSKLGSDILERHREEVKEELVEEIKEEAVEVAKEELRKDPEFRAKVVKEERKKIVSGIKKDYPSDQPNTQGPRYYRNVVNTFYRIRGWGVPMVLSMGKKTWDKTLPYIQGIHDWSGFLLSLKPDESDVSMEAPILGITVDNRKIVEAEYQIVEDK